jgi:VWFA-related protein
LSLLCAAFVATGAAQQPDPAATPPPRFKDSVTVARVLMDVRVVDDHGVPVTGLAVGNFKVELDGQPVSVESARWVDESVKTSSEPPAAAMIDPAIEDIVIYADDAALPETEPPPGRLLVLLFQKDLGMAARIPGLLKMSARAAQWMERLGPRDRVAVLSFDSQLRFWLDFTRDRERLERTLEHAVVMGTPLHLDPGEPPSLLEHFDRAAARRAATLETALLVLGRALGELPGPKSLVLFAGGMGRLVGGMVMAEADYGPAIEALTAAQTTVFAMDITEADAHSLEIGLQAVAQDTGGTFAQTYNFPGVAMALLERALAGHYELSLEAPPNRGTHTLEVKLIGRKGTVLARPTFQSY